MIDFYTDKYAGDEKKALNFVAEVNQNPGPAHEVDATASETLRAGLGRPAKGHKNILCRRITERKYLETRIRV